MRLTVILIIIVVLTILSINNTSDNQLKVGMKELGVEIDELSRVGIISVWADKENRRYLEKEQVFIQDQETLYRIKRILKKGKIDRTLALDRMGPEYKLTLYFGENEVKAFYWIKCEKYNLNIEGITGEITIDSNNMDKLIMKAAGEANRRRLENPY